MMRRVAKRFGVGLAVLAGAFVLVTLGTARWGDARLYPAAAGAPTIDVLVVNHGYHSGIVLPLPAVGTLASTRGHSALIAVATRFAAYRWIEVGWGDEEFYREVPTVAALNVGLALRALFRPDNPSVLHVVGLSDDPTIVFSHFEIVRLKLSDGGFERLIERLDATFARGRDGVMLPDLGPGLYGPSLFFRAVGNFYIANVCNHWVANLLDAAGVPTSAVLATLPSGLFFDLRWRSGVMPLRASNPPH
jgi:uncharacterized protein (TIGR02117 family)